MSASIQVNTRDLGRLGKNVQRFLSNLSDKHSLLDNMGVALVSQTHGRFEDGKGPGGEPWPETSRGGQILVDSTRLRDSITHQVDSDSVRVGTNVIYAKTHQEGAVIKPKNAKVLSFSIKGQPVFAREVTIPERPFLGLDDDSITILRGVIVDFVKAARRDARE